MPSKYSPPQKFIVVRLRKNKPAEVYTGRTGQDLKKIDLAPLSSFSVGVLNKASATLSAQVMPWDFEYFAPMTWQLQDSWSLGHDGVLEEDLNRLGSASTRSVKSVNFVYDQQAGSISWAGDTATGSFKFHDQKAPGWYLTLSQPDTPGKTIAVTIGGKNLVEH